MPVDPELQLYLEAKFSAVEQEMTHIRSSVTGIEEQARLTNGRVKKLELWRAALVGVLAFITAEVSIGLTVVGIVLGAMR